MNFFFAGLQRIGLGFYKRLGRTGCFSWIYRVLPSFDKLL